ncbi:hemolysin-III channel protein-like protein Izh2 [Macrophomina phaseolina]|uniref:Hemolysin-III channel protein-like protein Izh2 n=1 Tax=Macrophomina phaseolina TaxID=35725 RepID=A0ABQ8FRK5_9PEZI|nr:hemolysin-III channel protein-like protein Izh2 [Macrophomina phaseolina]
MAKATARRPPQRPPAAGPLLLDRSRLPHWMRSDAYILSAYRIPQNSFRACCRSLFYLHNETVNIWSHLSVGTVFLALAARLALLPAAATVRAEDRLALLTYLLGAASCCMLSASYHCINCHSERVSAYCLKLDYLGIVFNITSTSLSSTHFGLHDQDTALASLYAKLLLGCGLATFWVTLDPTFDGSTAAKFRSAVFIALCACGFAPIAHAALSPRLSLSGFAIECILGSSAFYLIGTALYVSHFPESRWPGRFDIFGASHQIFHVCVNVAQGIHLLGLSKLLLQRL